MVHIELELVFSLGVRCPILDGAGALLLVGLFLGGLLTGQPHTLNMGLNKPMVRVSESRVLHLIEGIGLVQEDTRTRQGVYGCAD